MTDLHNLNADQLAEKVAGCIIGDDAAIADPALSELVRRAAALETAEKERARFEALWEKELDRATTAESEGFADKLRFHKAEARVTELEAALRSARGKFLAVEAAHDRAGLARSIAYDAGYAIEKALAASPAKEGLS